MSPLSRDPQARARQLANLRPGAGAAGPGDQRRLLHGAYIAVLDAADLAAAERAVLDALAEDAPVRDPDGSLPAADMAAVRLLADSLVRLDGVRDFLRRRGVEDEKGGLRESVLDLERRLRVEAADHAAALGMTPRSRAALGLDLARTASVLDDELAAGRDAWERAEQRLASAPSDASGARSDAAQNAAERPVDGDAEEVGDDG